MARTRTRRRGEEQNLDSLLDTMANVTGILIVLLAVTQISMGDAMGRLRSVLAERPELTAESLSRTEAEASALRADLAPLAEREDALRAQAREAAEALAALRSKNEAITADLEEARASDLDALESKRRDLAGRELALRTELRQARQSRAELAARVATATGAPLARDMKLPDPRPAPPGASVMTVLVRYGRAVVVDEQLLLRRLFQGIERALGKPVDRLALSLLPLHERIRLRSHFERTPIGSQGFRWRIEDRGDELVANLVWRRETLGETAETLSLPSSDFRRELRRTSPHRAFLRYMVWADSFETYLAARGASDDAGFAAGFDPFEADATLVQHLSRNPSNRRFVD